jgi:hypothetical protein
MLSRAGVICWNLFAPRDPTHQWHPELAGDPNSQPKVGLLFYIQLFFFSRESQRAKTNAATPSTASSQP